MGRVAQQVSEQQQLSLVPCECRASAVLFVCFAPLGRGWQVLDLAGALTDHAPNRALCALLLAMDREVWARWLELCGSSCLHAVSFGQVL